MGICSAIRKSIVRRNLPKNQIRNSVFLNQTTNLGSEDSDNSRRISNKNILLNKQLSCSFKEPRIINDPKGSDDITIAGGKEVLDGGITRKVGNFTRSIKIHSQVSIKRTSGKVCEKEHIKKGREEYNKL